MSNSFNSSLGLALTLLRTRGMGRAYARWLTGGTIELPWGGSLSGFQRFSEFWSAWSNRPSSAEFDFIARSLATGGIAFDVGANVGMFTTLLASAADGVHAFEPVAKTFTTLHRNVGNLPHVVLNRSTRSATTTAP